MGITKTEGFTQKTTQMAEVFKAIGHPARLAIMEHLAQTPSCICNDIVSELPLAQPTISRHLAELKKVGLIEGTIDGKNICYCISNEGWLIMQDFVNNLSQKISDTHKCC